VAVGYALGIWVLVPLNDRLAARSQVTWQLLVCVAALVAAALAGSYPAFVAACFAAGVAATYAQVLVPTALRLASPGNRARTAGLLLGALLIGSFLPRTAMGALADAAGWRPALLAAAAALLLVLLGARAVPAASPQQPPGWWAVVASLPRVVTSSRGLLLLTALHACAFSAFFTAWAYSTVYAVDALGLPVTRAALIGTVGVAAGVLAMAASGVHARVGARRSLTAALALLVAGAAVLALAPAGRVQLGVGLFLLSLGMIASQVTTQSRALATVDPGRTGRANTVFLAVTFAAGSGLTALAGTLYRAHGFAAVTALSLLLAGCAAVLAVAAVRSGLIGTSHRAS